jgi:hypothetical protein
MREVSDVLQQVVLVFHKPYSVTIPSDIMFCNHREFKLVSSIALRAFSRSASSGDPLRVKVTNSETHFFDLRQPFSSQMLLTLP